MIETRAGHAVNIRRFAGDADRPALAIHCMLGSAASWAAVAEHLAGAVDLSAFDLPGHGRSAPWAEAEGAPDLHTLVTRIAASFITRPIDLIGHSFGATVALRIAVAAPEAIRSLTLIEPVLFAAVPDPEPGQEGLADRMAAAMAAQDHRSFAREFINIWGGGAKFDDLPQPVQDQFTAQAHLVANTNPALKEDSARILRPDGLEAVDAPVLLISGEESPVVIHHIAEALAARLPDVGRATIPGAGHMSPLTHPEQVAGLIALNLDRAR